MILQYIILTANFNRRYFAVCVLELIVLLGLAWRFDSSSCMVAHSNRIQHLPAPRHKVGFLKVL